MQKRPCRCKGQYNKAIKPHAFVSSKDDYPVGLSLENNKQPPYVESIILFDVIYIIQNTTFDIHPRIGLHIHSNNLRNKSSRV